MPSARLITINALKLTAQENSAIFYAADTEYTAAELNQGKG
jgi:hypothetical protein